MTSCVAELCNCLPRAINRTELTEVVTPVFKTGKREDPGNYRSVSLMSIPAKLMEQLIL